MATPGATRQIGQNNATCRAAASIYQIPIDYSYHKVRSWPTTNRCIGALAHNRNWSILHRTVSKIRIFHYHIGIVIIIIIAFIGGTRRHQLSIPFHTVRAFSSFYWFMGLASALVWSIPYDNDKCIHFLAVRRSMFISFYYANRMCRRQAHSVVYLDGIWYIYRLALLSRPKHVAHINNVIIYDITEFNFWCGSVGVANKMGRNNGNNNNNHSGKIAGSGTMWQTFLRGAWTEWKKNGQINHDKFDAIKSERLGMVSGQRTVVQVSHFNGAWWNAKNLFLFVRPNNETRIKWR